MQNPHAKAAPAAAKPAPAARESTGPAAPQTAPLPAQLGNLGMQALLAHSQSAPAARVAPLAPAASSQVHHALQSPGSALPTHQTLRLAALLDHAGVAPGAARASAGPPGRAAPLWLASADSGHEQAARAVAQSAGAQAGGPNARPRARLAQARVHTGPAAARAARALGARAFTVGEHIVFAEGRYAPHTPQGERLLLHELAHVEQHTSHAAGLLVLRDGEGTPAAEENAAIAMSASLDFLIFHFGSRRYREGPTRPQLWPLLLRRLLGTQYRESQSDEIFDRLNAAVRASGGNLINDLDQATTAQVDRPIGDRRFTPDAALVLIDLLESSYDYRVDVSPEQRELLTLGFALNSAWPALQAFIALPAWYTEFMFRRQMAERAPLLRAWHAVAPSTAGSTATDDDRHTALGRILTAIIEPIELVDAIRVDYELGNAAIDNPGDSLEARHRRDGGVAYRVVWNIELPHDARLTAEPPEERTSTYLLGLMSYLHTQPDLTAAAQSGANPHASRLELLGRFLRFFVRAGRQIGTGDERLFDVPARANAPAWNANMSSTPELQPPLFDAALETDHAFTMQLHFGDVFDAFAMYGYLWKFVRIPDPASEEPIPDPLTAAGTRPDFGSVWDTRLARARRYNAADLERVRSRFGNTPWGQAVSNASFGADLVRLNNTLRTLGTVIRTVLDRLTQPRNTTRIVFPEPGMYIVVCRAVPVLDGDEEVVRPPSIAMLPVVARDPDEMAVSRVRESARTEFEMRLRLAEIRALLDSPFPPENASALQSELAEIEAMLADPAQALGARRALLEQQIGVLRRRLSLRTRLREAQDAAEPDDALIASLRRELAEAGGANTSSWLEERDLRGLERQRDTLTGMITTRNDRARDEPGALFVPHATFVSDLGHSLALTLEMYDRGDIDGEYQVFISDLTTPDSGATLGTATTADHSDPRFEAVLNGMRALLENHSDYGRGRVAIRVGSQTRTLRIEAGTGRMLMEGIENGVTVLSLAAIVAAPFTAGESLMLLLPLGAVGAIPSAYRLYQRWDESRLRLDMAAVMDVVNIVGGAIGLAHAATPLRMVRMGRVLMVAGLGADGAGMLLMGVVLTDQILALSNLPEHERAAQLLVILGGAMLQIGILAGGSLAHARYNGRRETGGTRSASEPHPAAGDTPGFRPPAEGAATPHAAPPVSPDAPTPHVPAPGDRTAASTTPPGGPLPAPGGPAASTTTPGHQRLLDTLAGGIDYNRPPPAADVANPPPSGTYGRPTGNPDAAYTAYTDALASSAGREVGLFHNPRTGEYQVMVGDATGVRAPGRGWDAVVHYHPDGNTRMTFRLPAPHDFQGLMFRYLEGGGAVREFIEFDIPGVGRGRTEYGIEPGHPEPFYVRIHRPGDAPQTLRFAHDGAFQAYWGERTVYVEPGSPLYDAMVRDIQSYVRSLHGDDVPAPRRPASADAPPRPGEAPAARPDGDADAAPARPRAGDRTTAGTGSGPSARMTDFSGGLTDTGVAFIRRAFRTVREFGARGSNARRVSLESLSDAEIRSRFSTEPSWLEAVVIAEVRQSWLGRTTATDFVLANPRQTLRQVAARLTEAVAAGSTGHTVDTTVLRSNVLDFIRDRVAANDPTLAPAWHALENTTNPALRNAWNEFLFGRRHIPPRERQALLQAPGAVGEGFGAGIVGNKQPDVVEVVLSNDAIHILDPSQAWASPIHNFKTAFYEAVMRRLISVGHVTSADTGGGTRIRPIGP